MSFDNSMRVLICGVGSIGERHLANLVSMGFSDLLLYRTRNAPLRAVEHSFPVHNNLDDALSEGPDIAFICNPTSHHAGTAIRALEAGCHVFVEKPVTDSLTSAEILAEVHRISGKRLMVGYNMRFHPCLKRAKEWIESGRIGDVIFARTQWGEYLPGWHPWEDYRTSYAAKTSLGGGPALTLSHEIDTILWLLDGIPVAVKAVANRASALELETEHGIDILVNLESGQTANIHADYFCRPPARRMEIVGELGRIDFDYYDRSLRLFAAEEAPVDGLQLPESHDRNEMFVSELRAFLAAIAMDEEPVPGIKEGLQALRVAYGALEDARNTSPI